MIDVYFRCECITKNSGVFVEAAAPDLGPEDVYGVWKIDDTDNSFSTQPFRIRYARQDVLLSLMISFNISLGKYEVPPLPLSLSLSLSLCACGCHKHTCRCRVLWDEQLTMFKKEIDIFLEEMEDALFKSI